MQPSSCPTIEKTVDIAASPSVVWSFLTDPDKLARWLAEPEVGLEFTTTWQVGSPIRSRGVHHEPFENRGTVLCVEPPTRLRYSHLSSLSQLPDVPQSYAIFEYLALPCDDAGTNTRLSLTIRGCPDEVIYKHLDFYFGTTLQLLKKLVEQSN